MGRESAAFAELMCWCFAPMSSTDAPLPRPRLEQARSSELLCLGETFIMHLTSILSIAAISTVASDQVRMCKAGSKGLENASVPNNVDKPSVACAVVLMLVNSHNRFQNQSEATGRAAVSSWAARLQEERIVTYITNTCYHLTDQAPPYQLYTPLPHSSGSQTYTAPTHHWSQYTSSLSSYPASRHRNAQYSDPVGPWNSHRRR